MEESGIDISKYPARLVHEDVGEAEKTLKENGERVLVKMKFHTYKVVMGDRKSTDIAIKLDDEHSEYRWSEVSELKDMKLTPPSVDLFKVLGYL